MKEKEMPKKYAKTTFIMLILTIVIVSLPFVSAQYGANTQFGYGFYVTTVSPTPTSTPISTPITTPAPTANPTIPEFSGIISILSLVSFTLILVGLKIVKKQKRDVL